MSQLLVFCPSSPKASHLPPKRLIMLLLESARVSQMDLGKLKCFLQIPAQTTGLT